MKPLPLPHKINQTTLEQVMLALYEWGCETVAEVNECVAIEDGGVYLDVLYEKNYVSRKAVTRLYRRKPVFSHYVYKLRRRRH